MTKVKLLGAATVLLLLSATVALAALPPGGTFTDDDGSIFEGAIEAIAAEGITLGCNPPANDRFCPDDQVTRGEMAVFLARAFDYVDAGGGNLFVDDDGLFFESAADRLKTAGVTEGCNPPANDRYCGERFVSRDQMAAFLVRALDLVDGAGADLYVDDDGSIFELAIDRLGTAEITQGCNPPANDRFCPDNFVTRGQMAAFLARALGLSPIVPPPPASTTTSTTTTTTAVPPNPGDAVDCGDFDTWAEAQDYFDTYYPHYGDVANLDADDDLIACETLPGAP